ncbi:angiopoietin-related protein 4-like [Salarias fasciatus]|nr:angiopoietin-related protein 4-like [Salarias fasciatus]
MKTPQLLIVLVTILVHAAAGFPTERRGREKHASWDDVNVVAHGLLQLGQGLKEHVDKTKVQMRDVNAKLKAFNGSLVELERRQQEQDEALKSRQEEAEVRERKTSELAEEAMVKVEAVKKETEDIHSRMERLEEVLKGPTLDDNDHDHTGVSFIQFVAAQNKRIDQLVEKIKQQQDKLEKQSVHLQALQSKVSHKRVKSHRRRDEETVLRGAAEQTPTEAGLARDCHNLFVQGQKVSGVYTIQPENSQPFSVFCEMTSEGGWTIIQRRHDGSQSFNQQWDDYKKGFGSLNGEFWLGLDKIHSLSKQGRYVLQVELSDNEGQQQEVRYQFHLDGEQENFALHLGQESPSGLQENIARGVPFSTVDRDNDLAADINCAELLSGGWWFSNCGDSNLNGKYPRRPSVNRRHLFGKQAMFWTRKQGPARPLKTTLLKIAPASTQQ